MWIYTLKIVAEAFGYFYQLPEMLLRYTNLALVALTLLSTSQAQCPGYTAYSQVNLKLYDVVDD